MKIKATLAVIAFGLMSSVASADVILCYNTEMNHMGADDSTVNACLAGGAGNISGDATGRRADPFMTGVGADYFHITKSDDRNVFYGLSFTQTGSTGTFSIDPTFWEDWADAAIGFKFGTGGQPDSWFVYSLIDGVTSGTWDFFNVFGRGGGLSHINLYAATKVPEPSALGLFGLGLLVIGMAARRRRARLDG